MGNFLNQATVELQELIAHLHSYKIFPPHIQYKKCGDLFFATVSEAPLEKTLLMNSQSFTGMSVNKHQALSIALTEYLERKVCRNNPEFPYANEGVAGRSLCSLFKKEDLMSFVQNKSLNEAIERYSWAFWWDNPTTHWTFRLLTSKKIRKTPYLALFNHVTKILGPGHFYMITPTIGNKEKMVVILVYKSQLLSGVVSGGAAGNNTEEISIIGNALGELSRHANAIFRNTISPLPPPQDLYNQRLLYFASSSGLKTFKKRMGLNGKQTIILPPLQHSRVIKHPYEKAVLLYQSLFENQPPFIGGKVERLCL